MRIKHWLYGLSLAFLAGELAAQDAPKLVPALGWDADTQGKFVTSVVTDAQNNVWAGTEAKGLWRYDSRTKKWTQFTEKEGLGDDNVYALAVDKLGRVWAGHLNHGVSVWNGEKWKNYGLLDGPLGDRVFAIATCPTDGDVWIATDCGVARYSIANDDWDYFMLGSGLPSNQVQAIAFNSKGDIFVGTQCDGIAMATAADKYKKWKTTAAPSDADGVPVSVPPAAKGEGLPSSLINDIVVTADDKMVLVATQNGVGISEDGGQKWRYVRGQDWSPNVDGLYKGAAGEQSDEKEEEVVPLRDDGLLLEDWTTCIRQDPKTKTIWFGHRKKGADSCKTDTTKFAPGGGGDDYHYFIKAFCFPAKGPQLMAVADFVAGGLMTTDNTVDLEPGTESPKTPPLPSGAKPSDTATLTALTKHLDVYKNALARRYGLFLGDDWRTQGDWVGHYGNSFALICGIGDKDGIYENEPGFDINIKLGPHNQGQGAPETHIEHETSNNIRLPYVPTLGHRIEAELNDLGCRGNFPPEWEGPSLVVDVKVPAGLHCVSFYFVNNDVHTGNGTSLVYANIFRDYDVQLWQGAGTEAETKENLGLMARARVTDYVGGVYKQFVVAGPARFDFRLLRNHSFGTKLQGVFIDRLTEFSAKQKPLPGFEEVKFGPSADDNKPAMEEGSTFAAAYQLWNALDASFDKRGVAGFQFPLRVVAYRAAVAGKAPAALLSLWRWEIALWTPEDRDEYQRATAEAFKAYAKKHPEALKPVPAEDPL